MIGPSVQVTDSRLTVHTALSLTRDGDLDLNEFPTVTALTNRYDLVERRGRLLWAFPYGAAIVAAPVIAIVDALPGVDPARLRPSDPNQTWKIELPIAGAITAGTTMVIFALAVAMTRSRRTALISSLLFAFATPAWSTASRSLWQHTPSMFLLALSLYLAARSRAEPSVTKWLGLLLGLAFVMRPTNVIPVVVFSVWVLFARRRYVLHFFVGAAIVAIAIVSVNLVVFGSPIHPYFEPGKLGGTTTFWAGLAGTMVSPSRGLLLYAPIFLAVPIGMVKRARNGWDALDSAIAMILLLHWLLIASWGNWWGGSTYGPRLFTDVVPLLMYWVIIVTQGLAGSSFAKLWRRRRGVVLASTAIVLASVFINAQGALVRSTFCWNATPIFIEDAPERVWDWKDPQMFRGIRRLTSGDELSSVIAGSCNSSPNEAEAL
jgi:hypothetical protein